MDGFGERLRKLRRERDMTQGQLAEYLGVVPSAVGKYEKHPHAYPSVEILIKLSDFFNTSLDYLLKGIAPTLPSVENNINGVMSNSSFMQANHNGIIINGDCNRTISPEAAELVQIYEKLSGRDRLKLLNFAMEMEDNKK